MGEEVPALINFGKEARWFVFFLFSFGPFQYKNVLQVIFCRLTPNLVADFSEPKLRIFADYSQKWAYHLVEISCKQQRIYHLIQTKRFRIDFCFFPSNTFFNTTFQNHFSIHTFQYVYYFQTYYILVLSWTSFLIIKLLTQCQYEYSNKLIMSIYCVIDLTVLVDQKKKDLTVFFFDQKDLIDLKVIDLIENVKS